MQNKLPIFLALMAFGFYPTAVFADETPIQTENVADNSATTKETEAVILPPFNCADEKLLDKVKKFISEKSPQTSSYSVAKKRNEVLFLKHINGLQNVSGQKYKDSGSFYVNSVVSYLQINRDVTDITVCHSANPGVKIYENLYIVAYPEENHYKVVVTNLVEKASKVDEFSFVYE